MKPYQTIPIHECGEPLVALPTGVFAFFDPPPYKAFGADYGNESPWMLRQGVLDALLRAQNRLQEQKNGWKIMLFDAYRPNNVQIFMVEREFGIKAREIGLDPTRLTPEQREQIAPKVFKYWAVPSTDPATPPGHSTGAALDITLADEHGREVPMGAPIDEGAPPAAPDYFANATDGAGRTFHANRSLLRDVMLAEGFMQHPDEWWHFCLGDQLWAWLRREKGLNPAEVARYGRGELLS